MYSVFFAVTLSFLIILLTMPVLIKFLTKMKIGQMIQEDGPKHQQKKHTPTMAGVWLISIMALVSVVFARLDNVILWLVLTVMLLHMLVGMVDDFAKLYYQNNDFGLRARDKFLLQLCIAVVAVAVWQYCFVHADYSLVTFQFPGLGYYALDLGYLYPVFAVFMIVGSSNAVNLTDGLDGLVSIPVVCVCLGLAMCIILPHADTALWQHAAYHKDVFDLLFVLAALVGVVLGFLWFNCYPAEVFMGDSGSLAIGSGLATIAMILKVEMLFALLSALFVLEVCSVLIQVLYFKKTGARFFKMAPIHHHFELSGWAETKVVTRFWLISIAFLCISTMMML